MAFLSVRNSLKGELDDFLENAGMRNLEIQDGLLAIIERLKIYREEGRPLSPQIYLFRKTDADTVKKLIPYCAVLEIGKLKKSDAKDFEVALKKCAPLARAGWYIFISVDENSLAFGLFRKHAPFYAVSIENLLLSSSDNNLPIILVRQVAENVVQLKGNKNIQLEIHFSTRAALATSWQDHQSAIVNAIIKHVPIKRKEVCESFFKHALIEASTQGHGFLLAILSKDQSMPKSLNDGTILSDPISISDKLYEVIEHRTIENYCDLQAALTAIVGMLCSDGITVLDSSGKIRAYNTFIALGSNKKQRIIGGARKRTFEKMKEMVKGKELFAAFFQSQDGECECIGGKNAKQ